jgi:hypothetical protein
MAQFYVGTHPTPKGIGRVIRRFSARGQTGPSSVGVGLSPLRRREILELKASGDGILKVSRKLGVGTSVVQRVFNGLCVP